MGQVFAAKNKAKIPKNVSMPFLNRISKFSTNGWKKQASCLVPGGLRQVEAPPGAAE
jgi:hypothetical protein